MNENIVVKGVVDKIWPHLERIVNDVNTVINAVNTCHRNVVNIDTRVEALEKVVDPSEIAALINDHQSLQAQVRTLQFEMAKVMAERDEARKSSTPEYVNNPFNDI